MSAKTYGFTGTLFLQLYLYNYIPSWLFLQGFWYLIQFVIFSFRRMRKTILWQRTIFIENIFFQSLTHLSKQHGSLSLIQNSISSFSLLSKIDFFFFRQMNVYSSAPFVSLSCSVQTYIIHRVQCFCEWMAYFP